MEPSEKVPSSNDSNTPVAKDFYTFNKHWPKNRSIVAYFVFSRGFNDDIGDYRVGFVTV